MMIEIPEIKTVKEYNTEYKKAIKEEIPFVIIDRTEKYNKFFYDMLPSEHDLSLSARIRIQGFFDSTIRQIYELDPKSFPNIDFYSTSKPDCGHLFPLKIKECRFLTSKVAEIVMDTNNWEKNPVLVEWIFNPILLFFSS